MKPNELNLTLSSEGLSIAERIAQSHETREIFVDEEINVGLPVQIAAMREDRGWTQQQLAERLGMTQSAVSRLESTSYGRYSISTLKRISSAFDVGLVVRFEAFSDLIDYSTRISWSDMAVPSFFDDPVIQRSLDTNNSQMPSVSLGSSRSRRIDKNRIPELGGGSGRSEWNWISMIEASKGQKEAPLISGNSIYGLQQIRPLPGHGPSAGHADLLERVKAGSTP